MKTFDEMLRDFEGLHPTPCAEQFHNDNCSGYVQDWYCRIVEEDKYDKCPVIEFYSLDTNQFVSSYYVDTFLGEDQYGGGFGTGLNLWGDVPAWSIEPEDADVIRTWTQSCLADMGR